MISKIPHGARPDLLSRLRAAHSMVLRLHSVHFPRDMNSGLTSSMTGWRGGAVVMATPARSASVVHSKPMTGNALYRDGDVGQLTAHAHADEVKLL